MKYLKYLSITLLFLSCSSMNSRICDLSSLNDELVKINNLKNIYDIHTDEIIVNKEYKNNNWPTLGYFHVNAIFSYFVDAGHPNIFKVIIKHYWSRNTSTAEYLYNINGDLLYYKNDSRVFDKTETIIVYFCKNHPVKLIINNNQIPKFNKFDKLINEIIISSKQYRNLQYNFRNYIGPSLIFNEL